MIKITYDINIYRKTLNSILKPDDTVVELGCHIGNTSKLIAKKLSNGKLISLDNSPEAISKMNKLENKHHNLEFISGDVRLHNTLEEVYKQIRKCDVLSVDLGGGYHPDTVFKVYYIWSSTLKPRDTIIRNKGLIDFVKTSQIQEENIESRYGYLDSHKDEGIPPQIKEFNLWTPNLENK